MPENVRDRDELLLNAIVTGETSGIDPRDREETFIKAIAEKSAGSFYPFATTYEFKVDSNHNITRVIDGYANELDLTKIKPEDLLGSMVVCGNYVVGYIFGCTIVTSEHDLRYYGIAVSNLNVTFNTVAINFDTKKASESAVIILS